MYQELIWIIFGIYIQGFAMGLSFEHLIFKEIGVYSRLLFFLFFISVIWLPHSQLRAIIEWRSSLTRC